MLAANRIAKRKRKAPDHMHADHLFEEGENCWRVAQADRVACLVDGEAYFSAFKRAALNAQGSILIIGWDVNSRITLEYPDRAMPGVPNTLGEFLTFPPAAAQGTAYSCAELGFTAALQDRSRMAAASAHRLAQTPPRLLCP